MYVGRIVAVAQSPSGVNTALYRVSSRSYPNRTAFERDGRVLILPRAGHEDDLLKSPYIAYTCLRTSPEWAVVGNGHQVDPIADKLTDGMSTRDALAWTLMAMDYERDDLRTPRIAAVVPRQGDLAWLAIVRHDALEVKQVVLAPGRAVYLSTYGACQIDDDQRLPFRAEDPASAALAAIAGEGFDQLEKPVTSAVAMATASGFSLATQLV